MNAYPDTPWEKHPDNPKTWSANERALRYLWLKHLELEGLRCRCPDPYHGYPEWLKEVGAIDISRALKESKDFDFPVNPLIPGALQYRKDRESRG